MFKKLHFKLTAYMGIILILFMIFISTGIYNFTRIVFEGGNKTMMKSEAIRIYTYRNSTQLKFMINENTVFQRIGPSVALMGTKRLEAYYVIYDENQELVYAEEDDLRISDDIKSLAIESFKGQKDSYIVKKIGHFNYRIYTRYFNDSKGPSVVQVYQNTVNEEILWSFLRTVLYVTGLSGMGILLFISYMFTGKALRPIKETWIRQKEFIADASHELRTPLTVIQTNLDVVLSDDEGTVIENEMWLDNAYSETRVMAKLINKL